MNKKIKYVCSKCHGEDILFDAYVIWNFDKQEMELLETYDKWHFCNQCDGECGVLQVILEWNDGAQDAPEEKP